MKHNRFQTIRVALIISLTITIITASTRLRADSGSCGGATITLPFTDVMGNLFFCEIAEAFFSALTSGTTPTTYSPAENVTRDQMAAFITRTMDQSLKRGSSRAALNQFSTPTSADGVGLTTLVTTPELVESDGADLWVANGGGTVSRVRASDGKLLESWTGAAGAFGVVAAKGLIFVTGSTNPGSLYQIDPTQPPGAVTTLTSALGGSPLGIAFDGQRIWTANFGTGSAGTGSVSIVAFNPESVTTVAAGFTNLRGILYDGANIWVTDIGTTAGKLFKLNSDGAIIQTVDVGNAPGFPVFDGTNIWVPNGSFNTVTVVRASTGAVLATLTANGLNSPFAAAFDGERILITNNASWVSLWKAADLTPLGFVDIGAAAFGACSDGLDFWVTLNGVGKLARF